MNYLRFTSGHVELTLSLCCIEAEFMEFEHQVLVVDDDRLCLSVVKAHLEGSPFRCHVAQSAAEGWALLRRGDVNFSAILVDRMMPDGDGMELLAKVKSSPAYRHIPLIMITGQADRNEAVDALRGGVFDFLYKPVDASVLLPLLGRAVNHVAL